MQYKSNISEDGKWFREINPTYMPNQQFSLEIVEVLLEKRTKFQNMLVFKSKAHGNVLVLDNDIQCTERDEFGYQEMIAFLPLMAHPNPKRVLVVGGGDGGVLREVTKHPQVEEVTLCEIDEEVIEAAKKYLPNMAKGFFHPKTKIFIGDGFQYLKDHPQEFDVIITDSSDPEGPAGVLFEDSMYQLMKSALKPPHGIICFIAESFWVCPSYIKYLYTINLNLFPSVGFAHTSVPTYPSGSIGFIICSLEENKVLNKPMDDELADSLDTRFYTSELHRAAFVPPTFFRKALTMLENAVRKK